ncbi:MAG: hypothetical protein KDK45_24855, partial [Leptospiraceae bacterium]|nr:hypothetical protein [Leptospiraceae bacterium]
MIPHFEETKRILNAEIEQLRRNASSANMRQIELLENEKRKNEEKLEKEVFFMQDLMNTIYSKWEDIKKIRDTQGYISTPGRLRVHAYKSKDNTMENEFIMDQIDISHDDVNLKRGELSRRRSIQKQRIFIRLLVNKKYVARTKKAFIQWPSMEADFQEKYQLYLYAKPSSIQLQIVMGFFFQKTIDTINVPIPGDDVNTLTSSSAIYQEISFRKLAKEQRKQADLEKKPRKTEKNQEKNQENEEAALLQNKVEENGTKKFLDKVVEMHPLEGKILYKGQWMSYGPRMPPRNLDYIQKSGQEDAENQALIPKGLREYETENPRYTDPGFHIDVNDPRNEGLFESLRNMKNKELRTLLEQEEKFPFFDIESLRQKLLKLRLSNPDLMELEIPITDEDIAYNKRLLEILEEGDREMKALEEMKSNIYNNSSKLMYGQQNYYDEEGFPQNQQTVNRIIQ